MSRWSDAGTRAGGRHGRPWRAAGAAAVALTGVLGVGLLGVGLTGSEPARPPQPIVGAGTLPATAYPDVTGIDPDVDVAPESDDSGETVGMARSEPTTITIPRIGVDASIMSLGVEADGTVQVPPLQQAQLAGWYRLGAAPGEVGNAVIVGHVDSSYIGPAVFYDLGALLPGDTINVARQDGSTATFRVDAVRSYPKTEFPTELVYGPNDRAALRVVTCGGKFDEKARDYLDNVIVFATLVI
ncbi:class F sortase [Micromonospora echinospora]|uniref:Sortase family protein n=1 Tax=Micromonospora echinospora TaxID=1877 RepID=A0A1C4XQR6_MICEC|nr:class F sortase [Micromonospora echinospora]OZV78507.1 class F sortase [Micromonospora echinospora]SCF10859.1 Sortase family protein [Micromonospora echinospora]